MLSIVYTFVIILYRITHFNDTGVNTTTEVSNTKKYMFLLNVYIDALLVNSKLLQYKY